jgi:hypothetical protein
MILGRRLDLWTAAAATVINVVVLLGWWDAQGDQIAAVNMAFGAILALLANTNRVVGGAVLDVRESVE